MFLVMGCENPLAELLLHPTMRETRTIPQIYLMQLLKEKEEKSLAFEVEEFGPSLRPIETFSLEETARSKRSQNLTPL